MADYSAQQGQNYGPRSTSYNQGPSYRRDAAFQNIFGGAPPPGRSQTMPMEAASTPQEAQDRTYHNMPQQGHGHPQHGPVHGRPVQNGYDGDYAPGHGGSSYQPMNGYPPHQPSDPAQGHSAQGYPGQPLPSFPDRRPYPQPQRIDSRPGGPTPPYGNRQVPHRVPVPAPAMNSDAYRSRSMARLGGPSLYGPNPTSHQQGSAGSFRQQQYGAAGPRTVSHGRQVVERPEDRAATMSGYMGERDQSQVVNGRHAVGRRRESDGDNYDIGSTTASPSSFRTASSTFTSPTTHTRKPSDSTTPIRNISTASNTTTLVNDGDQGGQSRTHSLQHTPSSATTTMTRKTPMVYPALLSRVAEVFQQNIGVSDKSKNDLSYKNAFNGSEAVDLISYIIRTTDRNLALLLGRALDAQKFFHDVTYDHRLRDAGGEVYQFRETMGEETTAKEVNGVFTILTECYSPTCTRDQLCYSIACPRRLEQQRRDPRGNHQGLPRKASTGSLHDDDDDEQKLWINSVTTEVAAKTDERERKRQEVISEMMYTERDFVKDLEYLRDFWMRPLRAASNTQVSPIPEHRREKFIRTVFSNCLEILAVNSKFAEALSLRQREDPVVSNIGDIFLQWVPRFDPFIKYGANQMYGKFEFEKEKSQNVAFSKFVDETERMKESRKLELNGYLTKPTTRLARYPLLLDNVLKYTKDDNPDKRDIPVAIALIKDFLSRVNAESGKAENHFNLLTLNGQLKYNPGDYVDLKLTEENRQILTKMNFKKSQGDTTEITAYLFDHAVLLVRVKTVSKREEYRVYKKPIPLELLMIAEMDQIVPKLGIAKRPSANLIPGAKALTSTQPGDKQSYPITFRHLGKGGYELPLLASSPAQRKKFIEKVEEQQRKLRERNSNFYVKSIICESFFNAVNRVNCVVPIDGGRKLAYGTDSGIYLSDRWPKDKSARPKRILDAAQVTQIDTLEEYQLLLVLSNKTLMSYPLEALDVNDQNPLAKRPRKIQGHANFFKAGIGLGRHLVCSVKTSALSTTIKVYEPTDHPSKSKKGSTISKMFQGGGDALKPFKEFYIPAESSSVHYLRSTLCVGCAKGFEVVSLETTERQSLLDQADTSLDFVARRENVRPIHIERLNGEFLLNYSDFSFFVNRNGWRARPDWKIQWEGTPQAFALTYPYILAFEPSFVEIRHIETSELIHVITAKNIRMLHSSTREVIPPFIAPIHCQSARLQALRTDGYPDEYSGKAFSEYVLTLYDRQILYAYEDDSGEDVIASLDFWSKQSQT